MSEAFYLDDPEGNGIEVYDDRPTESWQWTGDGLKMITDPLDIEDIVREVPPTASYDGAPAGFASATSICASATSARRAFYRDAVGLAVTRRRARRIVHVVGSLSPSPRRQRLAQRRSRQRDAGRAGLSWFSLEASDEPTIDAIRARLEQAGVAVTSTAGRHRDCRSLGYARARRARLKLSYRPGKLRAPHALERLLRQLTGQLARRQRTAQARRLARPHRREIARALRLRRGAQRRERAGRERELRRHIARSARSRASTG